MDISKKNTTCNSCWSSNIRFRRILWSIQFLCSSIDSTIIVFFLHEWHLQENLVNANRLNSLQFVIITYKLVLKSSLVWNMFLAISFRQGFAWNWRKTRSHLQGDRRNAHSKLGLSKQKLEWRQDETSPDFPYCYPKKWKLLPISQKISGCTKTHRRTGMYTNKRKWLKQSHTS